MCLSAATQTYFRTGAGGVDRRDRLVGIVGGESGDQPGPGWVGGDLPEHLWVGPELGDVGEAVPADCERHGQVEENLAGIMRGSGLRHGASGADNPLVRLYFSAVRRSKAAPACDTMPVPLASTDIRGCDVNLLT